MANLKWHYCTYFHFHEYNYMVVNCFIVAVFEYPSLADCYLLLDRLAYHIVHSDVLKILINLQSHP